MQPIFQPVGGLLSRICAGGMMMPKLKVVDSSKSCESARLLVCIVCGYN